MYQTGTIIRTKLAPPRASRYTQPRPRLTDRLANAQDYRLTMVQAGPGYGKSTALAALVPAGYAVAWYHLDAEDADPLVFLAHLIHSFVTALPELSATALTQLERWERNGRSAPWTPVIDTLINELDQQCQSPLLLVLDDAHHLQNSPQTQQILDRLISHTPAHLHTILAARYPLKLPNLVAWRLRGELLEIGQTELSFTPDEIASLFLDQYGLTLTADQINDLAGRTEGWAIALQLVGQRLIGGDTTLAQAVAGLSGPDLFAYLTQEVLARQPADVREFLRVTAVLRQMTPALCDCLRGAGDSQEHLRHLSETGLFVVALGEDHIRYHHLFHDLLRRQLSPDELTEAHRRAARCCQENGRLEDAVFHLLTVPDHERAASLLDNLGRDLVRAGRLDTLAHWIGRLPPAILETHPPLLVYLGDIARLHSRFDEALAWYQQAETRSRLSGSAPALGQALRGQARIYLDTVNPSQADQILQEALRVADGQDDRESRARLLELLAENLLNQGQTAAAESYRRQARDLRQEGPGKAELSIRVLLRTGQLAQARRLLETLAKKERSEPVLRPRAHRETLLLLSLILSLQGEEADAHQCALEGIERGQTLNSPFVTAVGHMRRGHAWLLQKNAEGYGEAYHCFHEAIKISETLEVPRLKVEAYWGLCQAHGFPGDLKEAQQAANAGITLAEAAGDEWVAACIRTSLGAGYALAQEYERAVANLTQAQLAFRECGDTHGEAASSLWLSVAWHQTGNAVRLESALADLLRLTQAHGYQYLFQRRTLLGPPDPRVLVPLLIYARAHDIQPAFARQMLIQLGLGEIESHPGYQLRLQLFGPFNAWYGMVDVPARRWKRKKAHQLLLFFLTNRHVSLDREQILARLWPRLDHEQAQRDFKIAFNTLINVLEPERSRNAPSAYILRTGSRYGWRAEADVWLDVAEFESLIEQGDKLFATAPERTAVFYDQAIQLYQGEYLQEHPYEEWCSEERERLSTLFLRTAERLADARLREQSWEEAIHLAQRLLAVDDCWENAYRILMRAYQAQGQHAQAVRVFHRCAERLASELGVAPSPATVQLFESLQ